MAVLALVDGWPTAKIETLSEACSRGGLLFRAIAPGDVQYFEAPSQALRQAPGDEQWGRAEQNDLQRPPRA